MATKRYGCPGTESILLARYREGLFIYLTDLVTQEGLFARVTEAVPALLVPHRINLFEAESADGRTVFRGSVDLCEGRFVAEVELIPVQHSQSA